MLKSGTNTTRKRKRYSNTILDVVWTIPHGTKGNCYVFGLGPTRGPGGYFAGRTQKARPGDKCKTKNGPACCFRNKPFQFNGPTNCTEFVQRILCDNPSSVKALPQTTTWKKRLPTGYHMMAAILSPSGQQDFHFLRRFDIDAIASVWKKHLQARTPPKVHAQVQNMIRQRRHFRKTNPGVKPPPLYLWAHQRGWMEGGPVLVDAVNNLIQDVTTANFNYSGLHYNVFCKYFKVLTRHASVTTEYDF